MIHRKLDSANIQILAPQGPGKILGGDQMRREPAKRGLVGDIELRRLVYVRAFMVGRQCREGEVPEGGVEGVRLLPCDVERLGERDGGGEYPGMRYEALQT